jgi:hypothetical protein
MIFILFKHTIKTPLFHDSISLNVIIAVYTMPSNKLIRIEHNSLANPIIMSFRYKDEQYSLY